jgi:hypothetical protein
MALSHFLSGDGLCLDGASDVRLPVQQHAPGSGTGGQATWAQILHREKRNPVAWVLRSVGFRCLPLATINSVHQVD